MVEYSQTTSFNPMMMVNTSETCATTRLIQFRYLGISINNVSRNFQQQWHPENVPDLSKGEFTAWKKVLHQVSKRTMKRVNGLQSFIDTRYVLFALELELERT